LWVEVAHAETGNLYFYRALTQETSWARPDGPGVVVLRADELAGAAAAAEAEAAAAEGGWA
jgi:hypothetical protein